MISKKTIITAVFTFFILRSIYLALLFAPIERILSSLALPISICIFYGGVIPMTTDEILSKCKELKSIARKSGNARIFDTVSRLEEKTQLLNSMILNNKDDYLFTRGQFQDMETDTITWAQKRKFGRCAAMIIHYVNKGINPKLYNKTLDDKIRSCERELNDVLLDIGVYYSEIIENDFRSNLYH